MGAGASRSEEQGDGVLRVDATRLRECATPAAVEALLRSSLTSAAASPPPRLLQSDATQVIIHLANLGFAGGRVPDEPPAAVLGYMDTSSSRVWVTPRDADAAADIAAVCVPAAVSSPPSNLGPRSVCNLLWALAVLARCGATRASSGHTTAAWLRAAESALQSCIVAAAVGGEGGRDHVQGPQDRSSTQLLSAGDCANVLWGFAVLGHRPAHKWLSAWCIAWSARLRRQDGKCAVDAQGHRAQRAHPRAVSRGLVALALLCGPDAVNSFGGGPFIAATASICAWDVDGPSNEAEEDHVDCIVPPDVLTATLWALVTCKAGTVAGMHDPHGGHGAVVTGAALCRLCARALPTATEGELATMFWGLASLRITPPHVWLAALETNLADRRSQAYVPPPRRPPRQYGGQQQHGEEYLMAQAAHQQQPSESALAAGVEAIVLWSYATCGLSPPPHALDSACERCVSSAEAAIQAAPDVLPVVMDALQKCLWALAKLRHRPGRGAVLVRCADMIGPRISHHHNGRNGGFVCTASCVATVVGSYAQLGASPGADVLTRAADWWLAALKTRSNSSGTGPLASGSWTTDLCTSLWAFAALGFHPGEAVLDSAVKALMSSASHAGAGGAQASPLALIAPGAVCSALYAFGALGHMPPQTTTPVFLPSAASTIALHAGSLTARELGLALWGLSQLAHHPGRPWLDAVAPHVVTAVTAPATAADLAPLLWALLVLREHSRGVSNSASQTSATLATWLALACCADEDGTSGGAAIDSNALRTLLTAQLLLQAEAPALARAFASRASRLSDTSARKRATWEARALSEWKAAASSACSAMAASTAYGDVVTCLTAMRVPISRVPRLVADGMLVADVLLWPDEPLLTHDQLATCLQLDGPSAFMRTPTTGSKANAQATGATLLRDRLYEALRVRCVSVPMTQWPAAGEKSKGSREDARVAFLTRIVAKVTAR